MTLDLLWNALGWLAFGLNVWGNWDLTKKGKRGWVIRIACNLCWMPYGIYTRAWALLANHLLFVLINCHGWRKWRLDELKDRTSGDVPPASNRARERRLAYQDGFNAGRLAERRSGRIR